MPSLVFLRILFIVLLLALPLAGGCGDTNSEANFNPVTKTHIAADWASAAHPAAARSDVAGCAACHGADYKGGISKVACTQCHLGDQTRVHPLAWPTDEAYVNHRNYLMADPSNVNACKVCHGAELTGAGTAPSCNNCHMVGLPVISRHNWTWLPGTNKYDGHKNYLIAKGTPYDYSSCRNAACHGTKLEGNQKSGGYACSLCHTALPEPYVN